MVLPTPLKVATRSSSSYQQPTTGTPNLKTASISKASPKSFYTDVTGTPKTQVATTPRTKKVSLKNSSSYPACNVIVRLLVRLNDYYYYYYFSYSQIMFPHLKLRTVGRQNKQSIENQQLSLSPAIIMKRIEIKQVSSA